MNNRLGSNSPRRVHDCTGSHWQDGGCAQDHLQVYERFYNELDANSLSSVSAGVAGEFPAGYASSRPRPDTYLEQLYTK